MFKSSKADDQNHFEKDLEKQAGSPEHSQVFRKLEELETNLGTLLSSHIQEIRSFRESLAAEEHDKRLSSATTASGQVDDTKHESGPLGQSRIYTHVKHLEDFFDGYVQNVRLLQGRLNNGGSPPDGGQGKSWELWLAGSSKLKTLVTETQNEEGDIEEKTYDALMQQFNMQLIIVSRFFALLDGPTDIMC
ncbi:hypothetical protein AX14_012627 [Amanita brunnescens Koide BX004]|nr:hypothetical protein AX14_012627 [Amanita brunnescens Koide BX004]